MKPLTEFLSRASAEGRETFLRRNAGFFLLLRPYRELDELVVQTLAGGGGVHGQALQVGPTAGGAGQGVGPWWRLGIDPEQPMGGGVERLAQRDGVEPPEVVECRGVDAEDVVVAPAPPASEPDLGPGEWAIQRSSEQGQ